MKKITLFTAAFIIIFSFNAFALTWPVTQPQIITKNISTYSVAYSTATDRYYLTHIVSAPTDEVNKIFIKWTNTTTGEVRTKNYFGTQYPRSTAQINCNGKYDWYFYNGSTLIGSIENIITDQIQNPVCNSGYDTQYQTNLRNEQKNGNGSYRLDYDDDPNGFDYTLEKIEDDGSRIPVGTHTGNNGYFDVDTPGTYRLITKDSNGNIINEDLIGSNEFLDAPNAAGCNGCKSLTEMLSCPAWDDYMNEFSEMITGAIPPPPNMNDSMDYLIDRLAEQDVEPEPPVMPEAYDPGYEEQQIDLPQKIETDINPAPSDFEPETGGDGSGPVNLTDPTAWQPSDQDAGYNAPDPDGDTPPNYESDGDPDTPPNYNPPGSDEESPPNYNPPGSDEESPPSYETNGQPDTPPNYNSSTNNNQVPNYNYN